MPPPFPETIGTMEYPKRKHPRLKQYDYQTPGYYYVTIHTVPNAPDLSNIQQFSPLCAPRVQLTVLGEEVQRQLYALEKRFPYVKLDKYIIMPNHIHMILRLLEHREGEGHRPALPQVIGTYKSLTTRGCNEIDNRPGRKVFQTSFYESVLRNEKAYQEIWRYIDDNPAKWLSNSR